NHMYGYQRDLGGKTHFMCRHSGRYHIAVNPNTIYFHSISGSQAWPSRHQDAVAREIDRWNHWIAQHRRSGFLPDCLPADGVRDQLPDAIVETAFSRLVDFDSVNVLWLDPFSG